MTFNLLFCDNIVVLQYTLLLSSQTFIIIFPVDCNIPVTGKEQSENIRFHHSQISHLHRKIRSILAVDESQLLVCLNYRWLFEELMLGLERLKNFCTGKLEARIFLKNFRIHQAYTESAN